MIERIVLPTLLYDSETLSLRAQERRNMEVFEVMCLRNECEEREREREGGGVALRKRVASPR